MARLWSAHDRAARDLLREWRGREIDKSDGMLLLFDDAADAAGYALAYHHALARLEVPVKARAGLHVGPVVLRENSPSDIARGAKPLEVDGIAKPLAARVMSVALGGQTLLTAEARSALGDAAAKIRSHGHWRLKGIPEPIEVFEIGDDDAPFTPPADSVNVYRVVRNGELWLPARQIAHKIPAERDSFVGRRDQLRDLAERLDAGAHLVSVIGIGGSGKTRLITRFAWNSLGDFPGGVWFCDLSAARSLDGIARAVADSLDVPLDTEDPVARLGNVIAGRDRCLIVLDNFEQVSRHAQETVGRWLDRAAAARFVVTTREVLGLPGEHTLALPPLPSTDGAALFAERASSASRDFRVTQQDQTALAELATMLDGLPLAIELAAARIRVMSLQSLLARVDERFKLLASTGGRRDRQATLRATFDWSWDLLADSEKAALAQLSVFEGGFTLESAEAVMDLAASGGELWAADAVQSLVDKSFVRSLANERFDLLVSVQEYASEHLRTEGRFPGSGRAAVESALMRHWTYFSRLGEARAVANRCADLDNLVAACCRASARAAFGEAAGALEGAWSAIRMRGPYRVGVELASVVCAIERKDPATLAAVELVMGHALDESGRGSEARGRIDAAVALARSFGNQKCEARALCTLGRLDANEGRNDEARKHFEAGLGVARALADPAIEWEALNGLGRVSLVQGRIDDARADFNQALEASRRSGDRTSEGRTLTNLGIVNLEQGRLEESRAAYESALALAGELGDRQWESNARCNLGLLHQLDGRSSEARAELGRALGVAREMGHPRTESIVLCNLGIVEDSLGLLDEARAHHEAALALARNAGDQRSQGQFLSYLALVDAHQGRFDAARHHLDEGEALLRTVSDPFSLGILKCSRAETEQLAGAGESASALLDEAQALAAEVRAGPRSELGQAIARLQRLTR